MCNRILQLSSALPLLALMLSLGCFQSSPTPERFQSNEGSLWGYRFPDGPLAIAPHYDHALPFSSGGIAAVTEGGVWFYIDVRDKKLVNAFVIDNGPDEFVEGIARFTDHGKVGFINEAGKIVIPAQFDFVERFENGSARSCKGCVLKNEGEYHRAVGGKWETIKTPLKQPALENH